MTIMRPPVTGDIQLDSWTDAVTKSIMLNVNTQLTTGQLSTTTTSSGNTVNAITLVLYKASNNSTLLVSEDIDVETRYTYATGVLETTGGDTVFNGWTRELPVDEALRYVYGIQVNIADTNSVEVIPSNAWSQPIRVFDRGLDELEVDIIPINGNVFKNDIGQTEIRAYIKNDGSEIPVGNYSLFKYKWTSAGNVVCVNPTTRFVSHLNGDVVVVDELGVCPIGYGVPADDTEPTSSFSAGQLKSIHVEAQAVPNSGTLPLLLEINDD